MRDFYAEFLRRRKPIDHEHEQLPKLPEGRENLTTGAYGSNGSSFGGGPDKKSGDFPSGVPVSESLDVSFRIHNYNAIDAYHAKLLAVRDDRELAALVETIFEERIAIMLERGSSEEESEAYISSMEFLVSALKNV